MQEKPYIHRRANYVMTESRERHLRQLPFVTIEIIMEYMDCSKYVAELYVNELKLKINETTAPRITDRVCNISGKAKKKT